jgi:hypothetical protein
MATGFALRFDGCFKDADVDDDAAPEAENNAWMM